MSRLGSSAASSRIFAQISLALSSRTSEPSQMMRSLRSWSKMLLTNAGWAIVALRFSYRLCRIYREQRGGNAVFAYGRAEPVSEGLGADPVQREFAHGRRSHRRAHAEQRRGEGLDDVDDHRPAAVLERHRPDLPDLALRDDVERVEAIVLDEPARESGRGPGDGRPRRGPPGGAGGGGA